MKKLVDSNAPKRPALPFIKWRSDNTKRIINLLKTGFTRQELGQKYSSEWAAVTADEKKPYEDAYNAERIKYKKLENAYKLTAKYAIFQKKKKEHNITKEKSTRFPKDENAPKKPLSGYFMFLAANRESVKEEFPDLTHKEQLKKLGEMWSTIEADEKAEWQAKNSKAKEEYAKKLAVYQKSAEYKEYQAKKEDFNTAKKSKVKRLTAKLEPKKEKKAAKAAKKSRKSSKKKATKKGARKPKAPKRAAAVRKARVARKARTVAH